MLKQQVIQCDETEIMYYINNGFEIITQAPNPHPQPRIFFYCKKFYDKLPSKEELDTMRQEALEFSKTQIFY